MKACGKKPHEVNFSKKNIGLGGAVPFFIWMLAFTDSNILLFFFVYFLYFLSYSATLRRTSGPRIVLSHLQCFQIQQSGQSQWLKNESIRTCRARPKKKKKKSTQILHLAALYSTVHVRLIPSLMCNILAC